MLEKEVEQYLARRVKAAGGMCIKFTSPGLTGVPDRLVIMPHGRVYFVELKRPRQVERPRQVYVQDRMRDLDVVVFSSVDSKDRVDKVMEVLISGSI